MRKTFLSAIALSALFAVSAFAAAPTPLATSNVSLGSVQGTYSNATTVGKGAALGGAVAGNYTTIQTSAQASPNSTLTSGTQLNVGGTITK